MLRSILITYLDITHRNQVVKQQTRFAFKSKTIIGYCK